MDFAFENITLRKKNVSMSNTSMDSFETTTSDYLVRSLPDLSAVGDNSNKELREEINTLKCQLQSAHNEIENLILENNSLRRVNEEQSKNIEILSQITKNTPSKISQQKSYKCSTPKNKHGKSKKNHNNASISVLNSPSQNNSKNIPNSNTELSNAVESQNEKKVKSKKLKNTSTINNVCSPINLGSEICKQGPSITEKNKIIIVGDQRLRGLSTKLFKYKSNNFTVSSTIKPNAKTPNILNSFNNVTNLCNKDFAIIGVGTNDRDPYSVFTNLCNMLDKLQVCKQVFLVKVESNKYLNVGLLNYKLNLIVNQYDNCTYIDLDTYLSKYNNFSHNTYINCLYTKLKIEMDYQEYKSKFLSFSKNTNNKLNSSKNKIKPIKITYHEYKENLEKLVSNRISNKSDQSSVKNKIKGTIPYYFGIKSGDNKLNNNIKHLLSDSLIKKGTIPYYFNVKAGTTIENTNTKNLFFLK